MRQDRLLVTGALGQIGSELALALAQRWGADALICTDIRSGQLGPLRVDALDVTDAGAWDAMLSRGDVTQIYHLAAVLSATAERDPMAAWQANMQGLFNALEAARTWRVARVFWPSSIAVFGPSTQALGAVQEAVTDPTTVYGISKLAGERWCHWYRLKHGLDIRALRYPGLISWKAPPGGGTTDYAVDMLRAASGGQPYVCYLKADQRLPMMHMDDAVRACLELMAVEPERLKVSGAYNISGVSFTPSDLGAAIRQRRPGFVWHADPDFRQDIAATWPGAVDDSCARLEWGWLPRIGLDHIVDDLLCHLAPLASSGTAQ
jgi:nucleoside-diphosphate-sugar epimerase